MTGKDPDFSKMDDYEVAMMEWRGHMLREYQSEGMPMSDESIELARLSELADAELTKRGVRDRLC